MCTRSGPQGQLKERNADTLMAWKEKWGMGDSCFFLPSSKSLISFQASVSLFTVKCWDSLGSVLGKKWSLSLWVRIVFYPFQETGVLGTASVCPA